MVESTAKDSSILRVEHISKSFPGVKALDNVSFDVRPGEVLAILGENGAGKSTLMKILSGLYKPDQGEIWVDRNWFTSKTVGTPEIVNIKDPRDAMNLGIGMVYQHFQLVEPFTVTENITLGMEYTNMGIMMNEQEGHQRIKDISQQFGLPIDPKAVVENLPVGLKQRVEILKQLYRNAELLILDEPTAVLTPSEADELFKTIQNLRNTGKSIIFISHKLKEPLKIADRIIVLRKGQLVGEILPSKATEEILAEMVVGERVQRKLDRLEQGEGKKVLEISDLYIRDDFTDKIVVDGVSIEVRQNEIVGIAGVQGNGQEELIEGIMGLHPVEKGEILFYDETPINITEKSTNDRLKLGIGYIPEDRIRRGIISEFTVAENVWLGYYKQPKKKLEKIAKTQHLEFKGDNQELPVYERLKESVVLPDNFINGLTEKIIDRYKIKTPSAKAKIKNLSGGNQQKVIIGRELSKDPKLIIASEPTRGVDIGVMTQIHKELVKRRNEGTAILLVSSDLDEILALSDRLAIMYEGKIVAFKNLDDYSFKAISQLMTQGSQMEEKQ